MFVFDERTKYVFVPPAQCDDCRKWRVLPPDIAVDSLPDTWRCTDNTWDWAHSHCTDPDQNDEVGPASGGAGGGDGRHTATLRAPHGASRCPKRQRGAGRDSAAGDHHGTAAAAAASRANGGSDVPGFEVGDDSDVIVIDDSD